MTFELPQARRWVSDAADGWNRFWFTPAEPHTLALLRILAGAMMLYTHLVWALDLEAFLGPDSWTTRDHWNRFHEQSWAWTHLWWFEWSRPLLWTQHLGGIIVYAMLMLGLVTRPVCVLAWVITVSYCNRLSGALFGLDQVNAMFAMYLMVGPCGDAYSVDRWRASRRAGGRLLPPRASIGANVAIRLLQLHMCVIYLFGGLAKARGTDWWDGSAMYWALVNYEYQSLDVTWLARSPWLLSLLTHLTVFWETFYCCLIWPRWSRPVVLAMALAVHGGIAICLGMITFGVAMIFGNLAFVHPRTVRRFLDPLLAREK